MELKAKIIIELMGSPKEHIEKTMKLVMDKLDKEEKVKILSFETHEPTEVKIQENLPALWSSFSDVDISLEGLDALIQLMFFYMPSSIEIYEPEKIEFDLGEINNFLNDISARLHQYDMTIKSLNAQQELMRKEFEKVTGQVPTENVLDNNTKKKLKKKNSKNK